MSVSNARRVRAALICGLALTALIGCSSSTSGQGSPGTTSASSPAPTSPPRSTSTPVAAGAELERIALHDSDLADGYRLKLVPGGDRVRDQVTLDNCGFNFTTEARRVARRQYGLVDAKSRATGLMNELVAYDGPQQASKAVTQWHAAAAHCPRTAVRSRVAGTPKLVERITRNQLNVPTLPVGVNAITTESATVRGQGTLYNLSILQAKGRLLDNIYLSSDRPLGMQDLQAALQLASITGRRLAETR